MAERDGIWTRGGVPVEELSDPFAAEPAPDFGQEQQEVRPRRRRWQI